MTEHLRRRARAARALAPALLLAAAQGACLFGEHSIDPRDIVAPLSPELDAERERELGYEFDRALQQQVRVVDDPVVAGFLNDLGRDVLAGSGRQPHVYRFRIVPQDSLNAFAVPGGYIYFHSGTLMAAGSVDELAGVMGHEIAHVRLRHFARMQEQGQLPKLLSSLAGIAGAAVTGEPGILLASQGINVALELRWSREFESEADREGIRLVGASGLRPDAMARFFERIVALQRDDPERIPPYLFSHPDVDKRIDTVEIMSRRVAVANRPTDALRAGFAAAQQRLAQLTASDGKPVIASRPADAEAEALLTAAEAAVQAEQPERALALLRQAAARAPADPRVHFRIGELEAQAGRNAEAARAFRRTLELDPTRALVFFRLGEVTKAQGDAQQSVFAFEQAERRAGAAGTLRARAEWEVVKLTFPLVVESGLSGPSREGKGPLGLPVDRYPAGARTLTWWGRLGPRYVEHAEKLSARWLPPGGAQADALPVRPLDDDLVQSVLELPAAGAPAGDWTLEVLLDGDVVWRRGVPVVAATPAPEDAVPGSP